MPHEARVPPPLERDYSPARPRQRLAEERIAPVTARASPAPPPKPAAAPRPPRTAGAATNQREGGWCPRGICARGACASKVKSFAIRTLNEEFQMALRFDQMTLRLVQMALRVDQMALRLVQMALRFDQMAL